MLNGRNILVVEEEFLIALDIQRMLESHKAGQMLFARSPQEALEQQTHWPTLGLAIVELNIDAEQSLALAERLRDAGTPLILHTADSSVRNGHSKFPGVPVVVKPASEDRLHEAIHTALAARS